MLNVLSGVTETIINHICVAFTLPTCLTLFSFRVPHLRSGLESVTRGMDICHLAPSLLHMASSVSSGSFLVSVRRINWCSRRRPRLFFHCFLGASVASVGKGWWRPPVKPLRFSGQQREHCVLGRSGRTLPFSAFLALFPPLILCLSLGPAGVPRVEMEGQVSSYAIVGPPPSACGRLALEFSFFSFWLCYH